MTLNNKIRSAIIAVLDDDEGVGVAAYEALVDLGAALPDYGTAIFDLVEAADDRYYLSEDAGDELRSLYGIDG